MRRQRGQTLIFVGVMGLLLIAGVLLTYDVGRLVTAKIRFQNGADAAAVAAVALKINKHHLDTLIRWELTQTSRQAQAEMENCKALLKAMALNPQDTLRYQREFEASMQRATALRNRFSNQRTVLAQLLGAASAAPMEQAVVAIAQAAYRPNAAGSDPEAMEVVVQGGLPELQNKKIGGVLYSGERANMAGAFGKTAVDIRPPHQAQGVSILQYPHSFVLGTHAAAQIIRRETGAGKVTRLNWYSPRLFLTVPDQESREVAF